MAVIEEVLATALALPVEERAMLAERLLATLEEPDEAESDRLWGEEAERRLAAMRAGTTLARPAAEVYTRAERLLGA